MSYANPYLVCENCGQRTTHFDPLFAVNLPCGHKAGIRSLCHSWSPVDDCACKPTCKRPRRITR
jgi:hypothetical protein